MITFRNQGERCPFFPPPWVHTPDDGYKWIYNDKWFQFKKKNALQSDKVRSQKKIKLIIHQTNRVGFLKCQAMTIAPPFIAATLPGRKTFYKDMHWNQQVLDKYKSRILLTIQDHPSYSIKLIFKKLHLLYLTSKILKKKKKKSALTCLRRLL